MNKSDKQIFKKVLDFLRSKKAIIRSTQIVNKDVYSAPQKVYITPTVSDWADD